MFPSGESTDNHYAGQDDDALAIEPDRLRAALRLIFDGKTVDRIVSGTGTGSYARTIKRVTNAIQWEWRLNKIRRRVRRRHSGDDRPLGPQSGVSARGAITLALHLGLGLPIETIDEATSIGAAQLGNTLYQTRRAFEPGIKPACGQFVSSIGCYRDGSLDIAARATLIQHAQRCPACRAALDRFQALDARLLDQIQHEQDVLPSLADQPKPGKLVGLKRPATLITIVALIVVILGASGYAIVARRGNAAGSTASGPTLSGWLLTADVAGNLTALNLADGARRPFDVHNDQVRYPGYWPSSTARSPDGKLIANQLASLTQTPYQELVIERLDGTETNRIRLTDPYTRFSGWLGNDTVLEVSNPPQQPGESGDDYFTRSRTHSSLIGINVMTGVQQTLFTGAVTEAFPSPDGTMVAILSTYAQSNSGLWTFELRRIDSGRLSTPVASVTDRTVSDPLVNIAGRASSSPVWAPDSSRVYMATIDTPVIATTPTPDIFASPTPAPLEPTQLVSIARDGTVQPLPPPPDGQRSIPFTISPDGTKLIVEAMRHVGSTYEYRLAQLTLASGQYHWLTDWLDYGLSSPVWSPDGSTLLALEYRTFLISPTDKTIYSNVAVNQMLAVSLDGGSFSPLTRMAADIGSDVVTWLPEDAVPKPEERPMPVRLGQPQPVALSDEQNRVNTTAQVSRNDDYVILYDPDDRRPVIWNRASNEGRNLPTRTHDLSWLPHTTAVIGVGTTDAGQTVAPSRLATYAAAFNVGPPGYDFQFYDPAQVGASLDKEYATPLMSPNENALAFFVLDTRSHSVALWLAGYDVSAKPVANWKLPDDNKLSYVPIAGWIDNQTLLFAEPGDWHNGFPGSVQLNRLIVQPDGSAKIETAETLHPHGTERGIALDELAINQASGEIAYRLRHFTKNSTNDGIVDTISIASTDKLSDALEISRGGSSSGLSWSPDGRVLAATTPDALEFYSATGDALFGVSGLDFPNEPRWVDQNTVWFNESNDEGTKIMSVDVQ